MENTIALEPIKRVSKDILLAVSDLSIDEVRFLVDYYYIIQEDRKRNNNQVRSLTESKEPNKLISWLADQNASLEAQIKKALDKYTDTSEVGRWCKSIFGVGPVITAGLIAHIDITKAPTAGHIWAYGGYDPTKTWNKGEKRPWNASLKVLFFKIGQSFMKQSNKDDCFYGKIYREKKDYYIKKNENLDYKETAMERKDKVAKSTDAYKSYSIGKLPPGHIDARARRFAVKLFIAHLQETMFIDHFKTPPPLPYPIAILGHAHMINRPNSIDE